MPKNADKALADRLLAGDQASFDVFFNTYYPRLFRFALSRLGGDRDLADETAQVSLCQALSKIATYRGEAPLFSWLCTFCRYELSHQRKARDRAQGDQPLTEEDPAVSAALDSLLSYAGTDPDVTVYQAEVRRLIIVAMDNLPSLYADVLEAKYLRDATVSEIAAEIDRSAKATESVLTRARTAFRDAFNVLMTEHKTGKDDPPGLSSILEY